MKALLCPQCGASICLDDTREFGFCNYCGSKIQLVEKTIVEHNGMVSIDHSSFVNNLCKKGFMEIDQGKLVEASGSFIKASEYDCENILVIIGKMLTAPIYDHRKNISHIKFDKHYFELLKSRYPDISQQEIDLLNIKNCKLFFKCYVFFDDKKRVDYILEKFPNVMSLDVLDCEYIVSYNLRTKNDFIDSTYSSIEYSEYRKNLHSMLAKERELDIIGYLLKSGISAEEIFKYLHLKAYDLKHSSKDVGKDIYYMYEYHLNVIPLHVFKRLLLEGLSPDTRITFLKPYNNDGYIEHSKMEIPLHKFFKDYETGRHINFINYDNLSSYMDEVNSVENPAFKDSVSIAKVAIANKNLTENPNLLYRKIIGDVYSDFAEKKKHGCYVATCIYGSYDCPQVWTLRRYRDDVLSATWYGRYFIRLYYAISPTVVKLFGHTKWFSKIWRSKLDHMVDNLQKKGFESTPYDDKNY